LGRTTPALEQLLLPYTLVRPLVKRLFVVYVEGTLYASISLLEIGMNIIMPTSQGWEGNYAYL
jgi:hypothetical protein